MELYHNKYIKYKSKYISLIGGYKKNFYFIHGTKSIASLYKILKDGKIELGKNVPVKYKKLGGDEELEYIYAHIYFEDLNNLTHMQDYSLIMSSDIIKQYGVCFNKGWTVGPTENSIIIYKKDDDITITKKINMMKKFIKNPSSLPQKIVEFGPFMHHEILFDEPIVLNKYLLGIVCLKCKDDTEFQKIKKIIEIKYPNVKIFTENYPFPHFD